MTWKEERRDADSESIMLILSALRPKVIVHETKLVETQLSLSPPSFSPSLALFNRQDLFDSTKKREESVKYENTYTYTIGYR